MNDAEHSDFDIKMMRRAIELAACGVGLVSPNPLVGCVVVSKDGDVVGEGTYEYDKETHAEVIALNEAGDAARGGIAYVSLEPHDHHGRTPPCTEALINAGIARVVCPIEDPNPLVSGKGFDRLRHAGIDVTTGVLAEEAARLNEKFITWHRLKRPFVHLKLAMSIDGRISVNRSISTALSGEAARARVQELRHEHDAILVGATTAAVDDPALTDRSGKPRRRGLVRVVLDNRLRLPIDSNLAKSAKDTPTLVFTNNLDREKIVPLLDTGVEVVQVERGARNLAAVLDDLYARNIQSVLVEGGSMVAGAFLDARLVDKITFMITPVIIGGTKAPVAVSGEGAGSLEAAMRLSGVSVTRFGEDTEITGYPDRN